MRTTGARHVLSHTAIYLVARGVPGLVAFVSIPLFTRLLAPRDYGRFALVIATAGLLNALLFQWLRLSLVRYLPGAKDDPARLKSTMATVSLSLVLGTGLLAALALALPLPTEWRPLVLPCWGLLAAQALFDLCCEYSRSDLRPWRYMAFQVTKSVSTVAAGGVLVLMGARWWGPLGGLAGGMALAIAYAAFHDWSDARFLVDRALLGRIARYGIPLSITVALTVVISTSDRFLIAWRLGEQSAGLYSVATDFTGQTLTLLMMVINLSVFPMAVRAWETNGPPAAREQMRHNASLLMGVGAPCVVGLAVLAPGIAHCFLGKEYRAAATSLMPLVALATFVAGLKAYHFDSAFQFAHRTLQQVWIVLAAAIANVALNVVAIPVFGINGSAGASVAAYGLAIALTVWVGRRHFALPFPGGAAAQVVLAAAIMGMALYPGRHRLGGGVLATQVCGGALLYGGVLFAIDFLGLRQMTLAALRDRAAGRSGFDVALVKS